MHHQASSPVDTSPDSKRLQGAYRDFFRPECHAAVQAWYINDANPSMRANLKAVVHGINDFTNVESVMAKRVVLKSLSDPDVLGANAIFNANNGPTLIAEAMIPKTIQWLSVASVAQRKAFRETVGLIQPPKLFSHMRHDEDWDPERKYWKMAVGGVGPKVREIRERQLLHNPSEAYTLPSETIRAFPTNTGSTFVWKLPLINSSSAPSSQQTNKAGNDDKHVSSPVPQQFSKVTQRAHEATFKGAPWGKFGLERGANPTQWVSQTKEDFSDSFFLMNKNERRFQNYNENYIGLLSKQYRRSEKAKKEQTKSEMAATAAASAGNA